MAEVAFPPQVNCSDEEDSSTSDYDDDLFQPSSDEDTPTKDEEIRLACAWGMDAGITECFGNPYEEYYCLSCINYYYSLIDCHCLLFAKRQFTNMTFGNGNDIIFIINSIGRFATFIHNV